MQKDAKVAAEPGLFESWRQMRRERKARDAMTAQVPDEIAAETMADAAVLGYLVAFARTDGGVTGVVEGVTHTSPMDLESARREARKHGVSSVREWFPVELRRVDGG